MSQLLLIKNLPFILRQPTLVATVGSLGIHALVAIALPSLSASSTTPQQDERGKVQVVELTPAEMSRLPQLATQPLPPSAIQNQPLSELPSPPLPPPPPPDSSLSTVPLPPTRNSESSPRISLRLPADDSGRETMPNRVREESRTETSSRYQVYGDRVFKGRRFAFTPPKTTSDRQPQGFNNSNPREPRPSRRVAASSNPPAESKTRVYDKPIFKERQFSPLDQQPTQSDRLNEQVDNNPRQPLRRYGKIPGGVEPDTDLPPTIEPSPTEMAAAPEPKASDKPTPAPNPTEMATPEPKASDKPTPQPSPTSTPTPEPKASDRPTPTPSPTQTPTSQQRSPEKIALQTLDDQRMARLRADIEQQREALKRKDANTIYNETQRNIGASLAKVAGEQDKETQQNFVDLLDKVRNGKGETITIIGSYPRDACLKKLDGTAKVATVADATGKVIDEPMMITSDYKIFESEALSAVKKHTFDKTGKKKPYLVEVKFEYKKEICPQLSIPEAPPAG